MTVMFSLCVTIFGSDDVIEMLLLVDEVCPCSEDTIPDLTEEVDELRICSESTISVSEAD